jgi:hypothetical protein
MECAATPVGTLPVITSRPEPPNKRQPRVGGELPRLDSLSDRPADLHGQQCASGHDRALERGEPSLNGTFRIANPGPVLWTRRTHLFASTPNIERQHEQLAVPNRIVLLRSRDAPQHGGLQPRRPEGHANNPRARDISERINAHIDAALFRARDEVWTQFDPLLDK